MGDHLEKADLYEKKKNEKSKKSSQTSAVGCSVPTARDSFGPLYSMVVPRIQGSEGAS